MYVFDSSTVGRPRKGDARGSRYCEDYRNGKDFYYDITVAHDHTERCKTFESQEKAVLYIKEKGKDLFQHAGRSVRIPNQLLRKTVPILDIDLCDEPDSTGSTLSQETSSKTARKIRSREMAPINRAVAAARDSALIMALESKCLELEWLLDTGSG